MVVTESITAGALKAVAPLLRLAATTASKSIKENFTNWSNTNSHSEITEALLKIGIVKTIWSGGKDVYIGDFYYPSRIINDQSSQCIDNIDQLPEGNIVIQGIVGQGKSIFMRHLACSAITPGNKNYIPIFIELQKISRDYTIQQSLADALEFLGLTATPSSIKHLASKGHLVLLLDGFDEIPENYIKAAILEIDQLQRRYPKTKIIVSSRPISGVQHLVGFDTFDLKPLTEADYLPFLSKLNLDSAKRESVFSAITGANDSIIKLISTPLMLSLVVWVYESEQEIPSSLQEFFEKLFHVVFTRHDSLKAGFSREHHSGLSESKLQQLFEAFCFMNVQNDYGRSMSRKDFNEAFAQAIEYTDDCNCNVDDFRHDIVKVACLMLEEGIDLTTFLHKSILDYFAAAFIIHNEEDLAEAFYSEAFTNYDTWIHVIKFLSDADKYKYSKYYVLPNFPTYVQWLEATLSTQEKDGLYKSITSRIRNFQLTFNKKGWFIGWTTTKPIGTDECAALIERAIIDPLMKDFRGPTANPLVFQMIPQLADSNSEEEQFDAPFKTVLKILGDEPFRQSLQVASLALTTRIETAALTIETQAKKKKIFSKKKSPISRT